MGFFRKKRPEIIDFSLMQKKGLLPEQAENKKPEVIDFGSSQFFSSQSKQSDSGTDFLSSLAGAGNSEIISQSSSVTDSLREARKRAGFSSELSEIKIKLDNHNFKIDNLADKLKDIERKLREKGI